LLSLRSKEATEKIKPFSKTIDKIENIMSFLPSSLKKSYESMKQHLKERQESISRQIKEQ
jgi:hypothetical protein